MHMRKWMAFLCVFAMMALAAFHASAAGVTLRTFTPFADLDASAQAYMDFITEWEEKSGNMVEDYSGLTDEAWTQNMLSMVRSGEADVVIVPLGTGLTYEELVTVEELIEAVPDMGLRSFAAFEEADGSVLLSPLRVSFEALYVNEDVLEANGLSVPHTYEELLAVCSALSGSGVTPIANALGDWPEIVLDCAALASAPAEEFGSETSLAGAKNMLAALQAVGAFGSDPFSGSDMDAMQAFIDGKAAMRIDSDMLAQMLPSDRQDHVTVIPMPQRAGEEHGVLCGVPGFGVGITRACWADDNRCEAAIDFVRELYTGSNGEIHQQLAAGVSGVMGESIADMLLEATDVSGILYDAMEGDFDGWASGVIESLR